MMLRLNAVDGQSRVGRVGEDSSTGSDIMLLADK